MKALFNGFGGRREANGGCRPDQFCRSNSIEVCGQCCLDINIMVNIFIYFLFVIVVGSDVGTTGMRVGGGSVGNMAKLTLA